MDRDLHADFRMAMIDSRIWPPTATRRAHRQKRLALTLTRNISASIVINIIMHADTCRRVFIAINFVRKYEHGTGSALNAARPTTASRWSHENCTPICISVYFLKLHADVHRRLLFASVAALKCTHRPQSACQRVVPSAASRSRLQKYTPICIGVCTFRKHTRPW